MSKVIEMYSHVRPWDKQEWEDDIEYELFRDYCEERTRKTRRDSDKWKSKEMGELMDRNKWIQRANSYDENEIEERFKKLRRKSVEMCERHADNAERALRVAMNTIMRYVKTEDNPNPLNMTISDAIKLFDVAMKAERLARGEPDSIIQADSNVRVASDEEKREYVYGLMKDPAAKKHLIALRNIATRTDKAFE